MEKETFKRRFIKRVSLKSMVENKYTGGRFRKHDRDDIADKLVEWAKKDDSLNLCGFCADNLIVPSKITIWAKECENFRKAYELSKSFIANRRERKLSNGELHVKAYDLNANTYDFFLKEGKREEKKFESELKSKEQETAQQLTPEQINQIIEQSKSK